MNNWRFDESSLGQFASSEYLTQQRIEEILAADSRKHQKMDESRAYDFSKLSLHICAILCDERPIVTVYEREGKLHPVGTDHSREILSAYSYAGIDKIPTKILSRSHPDVRAYVRVNA